MIRDKEQPEGSLRTVTRMMLEISCALGRRTRTWGRELEPAEMGVHVPFSTIPAHKASTYVIRRVLGSTHDNIDCKSRLVAVGAEGIENGLCVE